MRCEKEGKQIDRKYGAVEIKDIQERRFGIPMGMEPLVLCDEVSYLTSEFKS